MRIAYLIHQDIRGRVGGSEVYAGHLARAARDAGHEVLVVFPGDGDGEPVRLDTADGIAYAVLDRPSLIPPGKRFLLQETFDNPLAYIRLTRVLTDFGADHLHVHHFLTTSAGIVMWARQNDMAVTATLHDYWAFCHRITWQLPDDRPCDGAGGGVHCRRCGKPDYNQWPGTLLQPLHMTGFVWRNFLLRRTYRAIDAVFVPSRAVLDAHLANGFSGTNLVLRPYGLPLARPFERHEPHRPLAVGYVGRLAPEKGLDTLLDAARQGDFALTVFGDGDPDYVAALRRRAADAPVTFAAPFPHADLPQALATLDALAVPSTWRENLPLVVLEAAQHGVPVLVSGRGGLAETPALCGAQIVPTATPEAWAAALRELADPDHWRASRAALHYQPRIEDDLAAHLAAGNATP